MRYAIYFTPPPDSPLALAAARWLGRDAFTGASPSPPVVDGLGPAEIAYHSASARRYGFHATLKAPFHLAQGSTEADLAAAAADFAKKRQPFAIPRLVVGRLDGFFALVPEAPFAPLNDLADRVVEEFDRFRAPLSEADIERRNPDAMSPDEFRNLHRWGYPHVFRQFRFHMTLTGRVAPDEARKVEAALGEVFAPVLAQPIPVEGIALFVEPQPGAPFTVRSFHRFERAAA